jgi:hypothetical protein
MFPRKWNAEFIEVPVVDSTEQHRPTFAADSINLMLNIATPGNVKVLADQDAAEEVVEDTASNRTLRMLIILAAASGMRWAKSSGYPSATSAMMAPFSRSKRRPFVLKVRAS